MEASSRFITRPSVSVRSLLAVSVAVALALMLAALALNARSSAAAPHSTTAQVTQHQQAPDAVERNDIYSAALAAREHESADAADRNAQLLYGQMLQRFNDKSPDAQERNIQLSGR